MKLKMNKKGFIAIIVMLLLERGIIKNG